MGSVDDAEQASLALVPEIRLAGGAGHEMACGKMTKTVNLAGNAAANK
jgi:hypothetical protein